MREIRLRPEGETGEEVEEGEEMDPEGECSYEFLMPRVDRWAWVAAEKHAAFVRARGRHYSGEAEAMKRAKQLLDKDEDEDDKMGGGEGGGEEAEEPLNKESIPGPPKVNGI